MTPTRRAVGSCAAFDVCLGVFGAWRFVIEPLLGAWVRRDLWPAGWAGRLGGPPGRGLLGANHLVALQVIAVLGLLVAGVGGSLESRRATPGSGGRAAWLLLIGGAGAAALADAEWLTRIELWPTVAGYESVLGGRQEWWVAAPFGVLAVANAWVGVGALAAARSAARRDPAAAADRAATRAGWAAVATAGATLLIAAPFQIDAPVTAGGDAHWSTWAHGLLGGRHALPVVLAFAAWWVGPVVTLFAGGRLLVAGRRGTAGADGLPLLAAAATLSTIGALVLGFELRRAGRVVSDFWAGPIGAAAFGITAALALTAWLQALRRPRDGAGG